MRIGGTIYLDHQATTPVDPTVLDRMLPYFSESFGNAHSSDHVLGWTAHAAVETAQRCIADLVGADPDEVIFTSGATEANNLAMSGLASALQRQGRPRVLVSAVEHKCVLATARSLQQRNGFEVECIPVDARGVVDIDALRERLDARVGLVSVMAVNNEVGAVQPVEAIASMAHNVGAVYHCDAAQGGTALDMRTLAQHADLISLSGHKLYGPKGVGALVIRRSTQAVLEPLIHGGGQQNDLRSGTLPVALCVGFGEAARLVIQSDAVGERARVAALRDALLGQLTVALSSTVKVNGPTGDARHPGCLNLQFIGCHAQDLLQQLQPGVAASTGSACASGIPEPSHVLRAMGLSDDEAQSSIRFSLGRFTTEADITEACIRIVEVVRSTGRFAGALGSP